MDRKKLTRLIQCISIQMNENRDYLIELDQQAGDGDLGISMSNGFQSAVQYLTSNEEADLGLLFSKMADAFNEAAPSSLGTIIVFFMKGMAVNLKGKAQADYSEMVSALEAGLNRVMQRTGSKPGEKTILDSLCPAVTCLRGRANEPEGIVIHEAVARAEAGAEATRQMKAVWGRAAYYGEKSIGLLDGGAVAGLLIFKGIEEWFLKSTG